MTNNQGRYAKLYVLAKPTGEWIGTGLVRPKKLCFYTAISINFQKRKIWLV